MPPRKGHHVKMRHFDVKQKTSVIISSELFNRFSRHILHTENYGFHFSPAGVWGLSAGTKTRPSTADEKNDELCTNSSMWSKASPPSLGSLGKDSSVLYRCSSHAVEWLVTCEIPSQEKTFVRVMMNPGVGSEVRMRVCDQTSGTSSVKIGFFSRMSHSQSPVQMTT